MQDPVISIIIPAYNEEACIAATLASLRNQVTQVPYEIIVCDNNSTDKTTEIAKQYADCVLSEQRQGGFYARNTAAAVSKGKYQVHTDADAWFPPDFIERVFPIFETEKYAGFTCGHWDYYTGKSLWMKIKTCAWALVNYLYKKRQMRRNLMALPGWCICTPRAVFAAVGGFPEQTEILEDLAYSLRIEYLGDFGYFPDIRVRSSTRRLEDGIIKFERHYAKKHAGMKHMLQQLGRKRLTAPYDFGRSP